jgi:phosphate transport system protein
VPVELRIRFHRRLDEIDAEVVRLFGIVRERVAAATDSFATGDTELALDVTSRDVQVDDLEREVEQLTERLLLTESPMCGDLRYLVTVLRIVPQLERCGDLAEHVAQRTVTGLGLRLTPRTRELLAQMGRRCVTMWGAAAHAWATRDPHAAEGLDVIDDELDALHDELSAEILTGGLTVADAMQVTLVGRFYERLGDHAVHLAQRIAYLAPGRAS